MSRPYWKTYERQQSEMAQIMAGSWRDEAELIPEKRARLHHQIPQADSDVGRVRVDWPSVLIGAIGAVLVIGELALVKWVLGW